jgi:hypothetical protein
MSHDTNKRKPLLGASAPGLRMVSTPPELRLEVDALPLATLRTVLSAASAWGLTPQETVIRLLNQACGEVKAETLKS